MDRLCYNNLLNSENNKVNIKTGTLVGCNAFLLFSLDISFSVSSCFWLKKKSLKFYFLNNERSESL